MKHSPCLILCCLPAVLAACGPAVPDPGPEPATIEESRALEEAAEMIEQSEAKGSSTHEIEGQAAPTPVDVPTSKPAHD